MKGFMPNTWLNDENINFYMEMLNARDAALCQQDRDRMPSYFFS
jgi:Ulp1 family protease